MKIAMVCESLGIPSGFGEQSRMVAEGLAERGHEVVIISRGKRKQQFPNVREIGLADMYNLNAIDEELHREKPDACIFFWHFTGIALMCRLKSVTANVPTFAWLPWEGSTLSPGFEMQFIGVPDNAIVHLSEFSHQLWGDRFSKGPVIPHCYDEEIWKLPEMSERELRRKWAKKLRFPIYEDSLVILNLDRNIWHKRWDLTMDYMRRLSDKHEDCLLIAHTKKNPDASVNTPQDRHSGYDLEELAKTYGVDDRIVFTDFDWKTPLTRQELIELYALCDFRISTSAGEGFGVPTLEAAALGVKQIVNGCTTMPEILGESYPGLIPPAASYVDRGAIWQAADVKQMVETTLDEHEVRGFYSIDNLARFTKTEVTAQWEKLLTGASPKGYHREGWVGVAMYKNQLQVLAQLMKEWFPHERVLQLGVYDGYFLQLLAELGVDFVGIEPDLNKFNALDERIRSRVIHGDITTTLPETNIVVCSDLTGIASEAGKLLTTKLSFFKWAFLRFEKSYKWDQSEVDLKKLRMELLSHGMLHRMEIEDHVPGRKHDNSLAYEIWTNSADLGILPRPILEKIGAAQNGNKH
jgi:glycosyltransferase involved in cell wall biosynthesis